MLIQRKVLCGALLRSLSVSVDPKA
uniref:Uncharacterized protein n=1 Tax=Rhizophora mucronata TaxID=61149 RepID=A0A2P2PRS9_RHIMU